jgi:hypothetical protein
LVNYGINFYTEAKYIGYIPEAHELLRNMGPYITIAFAFGLETRYVYPFPEVVKNTPFWEDVVDAAIEGLNLISNVMEFHASDPRDKIYSITGLLENCDDGFCDDIPRPDYALPVHVVYQSFTEF